MKSILTFYADIYIAGELAEARNLCRRFCGIGLCVTVEPLDFIYAGGCESGVRVGLREYPRFPMGAAKIKEHMIALAEVLRDGLCQHSWMIVMPDETIWHSTRAERDSGVVK